MRADGGRQGLNESLRVAIWLFVGAIKNQIIAVVGLKSCCRGLVIAV